MGNQCSLEQAAVRKRWKQIPPCLLSWFQGNGEKFWGTLLNLQAWFYTYHCSPRLGLQPQSSISVFALLLMAPEPRGTKVLRSLGCIP